MMYLDGVDVIQMLQVLNWCCRESRVYIKRKIKNKTKGVAMLEIQGGRKIYDIQ